MVFTVPQGKHKSRPFRFWIWFRKRIYQWQVCFDFSCIYDLYDADQGDCNKLCGVGFLPGHHTDSARFGWRYDAAKNQIELLAYCYVNKNRIIKPMCFLDMGVTYNIEIGLLSKAYVFYCSDDSNTQQEIARAEVTARHNKKLKYRLGVFFGGNKKAPHDIKINLTCKW